MTNEEAIKVLLDEWKCIDRNDGINCDRQCEKCDLVMDSAILKDAYNMAIQALSQEPCEDVVSRKDIQDYIAKYLSQYLYEDVRQAVEAIDTYIGDMPSVTQKSGKWILTIEDWNKWTCSNCGYVKRTDIHVNIGWKFCPNCGCRMVEPQESEEISDRNMKMWEGIFKAERRNE